MVSRMSQLLIVALAVLLVCSLADATYRKPPFNGSIFGKRASQAGRPYSIQSIPLLLSKWECGLYLFGSQRPGYQSPNWDWDTEKLLQIPLSVLFQYSVMNKLNYTHQLRAEFEVKLKEPVLIIKSKSLLASSLSHLTSEEVFRRDL